MPEPPRIVIDVSALTAFNVAEFENGLPPISGTISGVWNDQERCSICQQLFTPGPEGIAILKDATTETVIGPICPACVMKD